MALQGLEEPGCRARELNKTGGIRAGVLVCQNEASRDDNTHECAQTHSEEATSTKQKDT